MSDKPIPFQKNKIVGDILNARSNRLEQFYL